MSGYQIPGYNFVLRDDVDYSAALPPHLVAQQPPPPTEAELQHRAAGMFLMFPLPESHPAFGNRDRAAKRHAMRSGIPDTSERALQAPRVRETAEVRSRRELLQRREQRLAAHWTGVAEEPATSEQQQQRPRRVTARPAPKRSSTPPPPPPPPQQALLDELVAAQLAAEAEERSILRRVLEPPPQPPSARLLTPPPPASTTTPFAAPAEQSARDATPSPRPAWLDDVPQEAAPPPAQPQPQPQRSPQPQPTNGSGRSVAPRHRSSGNIIAHETATPNPPPARRRRGGGGGGGGGGGANEGWELNDFSYEALLELGSMAVPTGLGKVQLQSFKPVAYAGRPGSAFKRPAAKKAGAAPTPLKQQRAPTVQLEDCAICLDEMALGAMVLTIGCGHTYHHACLIAWLARTNQCPTCRFEIQRRERLM